jgi:hypothetical protein
MSERDCCEFVTVNGMRAGVPAASAVTVLAKLCLGKFGPGVLVRIREGEYAWGEPLAVPEGWAVAIAGQQEGGA